MGYGSGGVGTITISKNPVPKMGDGSDMWLARLQEMSSEGNLIESYGRTVVLALANLVEVIRVARWEP